MGVRKFFEKKYAGGRFVTLQFAHAQPLCHICLRSCILLVSLTYLFDSLHPFSVYVSMRIQLVYVLREIILGYDSLNHYLVN